MENADFWAGKSIFLTGGTGFFGKSILDMLLLGALPQTRWTILSRDPAGFLAQYPEFAALKQIRFLQGDVKDFPFPQQSFDLILHAATPAVTDLPQALQTARRSSSRTPIISVTSRARRRELPVSSDTPEDMRSSRTARITVLSRTPRDTPQVFLRSLLT